MIDPLASPRWPGRIAALASILTRPMLASLVCTEARDRLDWGDALTLNVLAAGERSAFVCVGNLWRTTGAASVVATQPVAVSVKAPPTKPRKPARSSWEPRHCPGCEEKFEPRSGKQVCCSSTCRQRIYGWTKVVAA